MRTLPSLSCSNDVTLREGLKELKSASSASFSWRDMMAVQWEAMPRGAASGRCVSSVKEWKEDRCSQREPMDQRRQ